MCLVSSILVTLERVRAAAKTLKLAIKHIKRSFGQRSGCRRLVVITVPERGKFEPEGKAAVSYLFYLIF